jgi:hypothetical protein
MTGTGADRYALAAAMSEAWVSFAHTGNPNDAGIPSWTPFEPTTRPTMVFGPQVALVADPHGEERRAMKACAEAEKSTMATDADDAARKRRPLFRQSCIITPRGSRLDDIGRERETVES